LIFGERRELRQVTPSTRVSVLRALIARTFGISVRKRKMTIVDMEDGGTGRREFDVTGGDGSRELGWFIQGRRGEVIIY